MSGGRDSREYGAWADWLGAPRHSFSAEFGAVIAQGRDYRETFQVFRPGFDLAEERERRGAAGQAETFGAAGLFRMSVRCFHRRQVTEDDAALLVGLRWQFVERVEQRPSFGPAGGARPSTV